MVTDDIAYADDIRFAYEGTDIISCLQSKYIMRRKPYIILRQQYFIDPTRKIKNAKKVVDKWVAVWYYLGVVRTQLLRNEICASGGIGRLARFRF